MKNYTKSLITIAWNGYWEKYGKKWSSLVNNFNTSPNEIIIVSDRKVDTLLLKNNNIKNIVIDKNFIHFKNSYFRNIGVQNSSCDWLVFSDLDDEPMANYLDGLDKDSDIHGFSFFDKEINKIISPNEKSLEKRFLNIFDYNLIPGTSAIKRKVFNILKYEDNCIEDHVFYKMAKSLNLSLSYDDDKNNYRFIYTKRHKPSNAKELERVTHIYDKVLHENRNLYCFWFSQNKMSINRKRALKTLQKNCGVNLKLINLKTFYEYENIEIPIHPGFEYLTDVHKSDYAKVYMAYFYGEGYSDIKADSFDWNIFFDELFLSKYNANSSPTQSFNDLGNFWKEDIVLKKYISENYYKISENGHYIFKPKTIYAYEWLMMLHDMLNKNFDQLKNNPGLHPYVVNGGIVSNFKNFVDPSLINKNYPFGWTDVGGIPNHIMQYKTNFSNFLLNMPNMNMKNYR